MMDIVDIKNNMIMDACPGSSLGTGGFERRIAIPYGTVPALRMGIEAYLNNRIFR